MVDGAREVKALRYAKARLGERSTWVGVMTAATSAAVIPEPWSYILFAAGVVMVIVPEGKKEPPPCP